MHPSVLLELVWVLYTVGSIRRGKNVFVHLGKPVPVNDAATVCSNRSRIDLGGFPMTTDVTQQTQATLAHHLQALGEGIDAILNDYTEDSILFSPNVLYVD